MSKQKKTDEDITSTGNVPIPAQPLTIVPLKPIFPSTKKKKDEDE